VEFSESPLVICGLDAFEFEYYGSESVCAAVDGYAFFFEPRQVSAILE
jgi:hypothetical protein